MTDSKIKIPCPELQISFSEILRDMRVRQLQEALGQTILNIALPQIDEELAAIVPHKYLSELASKGLRGEFVFPVSIILKENPYLLAYYRLLLGFSQKAFYTSDTGAGKFKNMEAKGIITTGCKDFIHQLCEEMTKAACLLIEGIGPKRLTFDLLDDLTLLTLGAQLRGSNNVKIGAEGLTKVFDIISDIVSSADTIKIGETSLPYETHLKELFILNLHLIQIL